MRIRHLLLAVGIGCLGSCLAICQLGSRYSCRSDSDCDTGANKVCGGVDIWVDDSCTGPATADEPFYISEPGDKTCYFFYCVDKGQRDCGDKQCKADETCVGVKNGDKVAVECLSRETMNSGSACDGFDDTANCPDGRRVRYLEYRRNNPTSADTDYRCLPQ